MLRNERKILSIIMAIVMITALLPIGLTASAVTPGNITNLVTKYTGSATTYATTGATNAGLYVYQGSTGVPSTKYDSTTGYATDQARIDAALANNPYFTSDKSTWIYGDRDPNKVFSGADTNNPIFSQTQYVALNTTSSRLLGPNVTKILALNGEKNFTAAIPDLYSFDIDKPATIYVNSMGSYDSVFVTTYGWTKDTSVTLVKSSAALLVGSDAKYYSVPSGGGTFGNFYSKHYTAGTVNIPSRGASANNGYVIYVVWDADGSGDTTLSTLSYNDGTNHNIAVVSGQTTYNVKASAGSTPIVTATLTDIAAEQTITQATGVPGTATLVVASGINTQTYTINFTPAGLDTIYVEKSNATGASGITVAKNMGTYPTAPIPTDFSGTAAYAYNSGNAGTPYWNFNDGNGDVNFSRSYTNFGSNTTSMRNQGQGGGSSNSAYIKMDLSSLDTSRSIQQAKMTVTITGASTNYAGTNPSLYIDIYEVAETKWISGTGSGEAYFNGSAPNKTFTPAANYKLFPLVNKSGAILAGSGDVSVPYPLTYAVAPDNTSSIVTSIKNAAYAKKLTTVYVGQMAASGTIGTVGVDVTKSVRDKLAAGATTASFRLSITPYIYGTAVPTTQNDMTFNITDTGTNRPKLDVTSTASGTYASGDQKIAYITLGDKATYSTSGKKFESGHTPIDLGKGFDPTNTSLQTFNITTADLYNGKVSLNAFAQNALSTVSINGAAATADYQSAAIMPAQGVATAQVVVTAPNSDTMTYNLKFVVTDYVQSTDASLKTLTYTHPMLGKKSITLSSGVTAYDVVLPYGISSEIPQVTGVVNNIYASIQSTTQASGIVGTASIAVKAEAGNTSTYTVNFTVSQTPPVVDHQHGNATNVKSRYQNTTTAYSDPQTDTYVYAVQGSTAVPVTKYDASTGYETLEARRLATVAATNPYNTSDTTAWTFGDRAVTSGGNGSSSSAVIQANNQFAVVNTTSSLFLGANVTKILTRNDAKGFTLTIPNLYTFDIDKAATVYVACENTGAAMDTNFITNNAWKKETGLKANRASVPYPAIAADDGLYYAFPNGATNSAVVYSKHYIGGANVEIPSSGMTTSGGVVVYVVWDECNTNTALSGLSVNGTDVSGFKSDITTYTVELPYGTTEIPTIAGTPAFSGAGVAYSNPSALPGSATVTITAADTVTTGTYTIHYTIAKADPEVTWPTVGAITYGQTFAAAISGGVGDGVFTIADGAVVPDASATPYTKTITFTPNDTDTYKTVTKDVSITVNNAPQSAPTLNYTKTKTTISITPVEGAEYGLKLKSSTDDVLYGTIAEFADLTSNTVYTVYIRLAAKTNYDASAPTIIDITTDSDIAKGDVSGDGIIDISDVIMAAEIAVGVPGYTAQQIDRANVSDKNDATVDISDVVMIAERAVGGTTPFPVDVK